MDWIKTKYDRLLLGLFGVIALAVGGLLLVKVMGWKGQFKTVAATPRKADKAEVNHAEKITNALTALKAPAAVKAPVGPSGAIGLFNSAPVIKIAGETELITLIDKDAKQIRPPVDNKWIIQNGLDITIFNINEMDDDGDSFTNQQEFEADPKTHPRDAKSRPPTYVKIQFKECLKDPMTIRLNTCLSEKEIQFRRTEPADKAFNTQPLKVGDSFAVEKDSTTMRFKITKADLSDEIKPKVTIDDLLTEAEEAIECVKGDPKEFPILKARLAFNLGKEEEKVVTLGEEFTFEGDPDQKYKVKNLTETEITLEFTLPEAKEPTVRAISIAPPP
jgi:hypothetical protein